MSKAVKQKPKAYTSNPLVDDLNFINVYTDVSDDYITAEIRDKLNESYDRIRQYITKDW